jgi:hypothetical protein
MDQIATIEYLKRSVQQTREWLEGLDQIKNLLLENRLDAKSAVLRLVDIMRANFNSSVQMAEPILAEAQKAGLMGPHLRAVPSPDPVEQLASELGGKVVDRLPHGSAVVALPLPKDHWLYKEGHDEPPAPMRIGRGERRSELAAQVQAAARYAVRASTMNGKEKDWDPDAMVQNMIVGLLGYWTEDGHSHLGE